ncbi:MAG TPA: hypothetical protein DCZ88_00130 [Pseudanabaena sp.]|nr:hypothetical protein [Pseudanabaena sp.]
MRSPFPGMNPYLEHPELWSSVHSRLIVAIADALADMLSQDYRIDIEKRTYWHDETGDDVLIGIPDVSLLSRVDSNDTNKSVAVADRPSVQPTKILLTAPEEISERYLEIREVKTGKVITAIEILSPKNKRIGEGKEAYLRKRRKVLQTQTHLIEIDLLRINSSFLHHYTPISDYRILISRSHDRPSADLYAFSVRDRIPDIPIPLRPNEVEPILDLQAILQQIYQRGRYDMAIDYSLSPDPVLNKDDQEWAKELVNHG